MIEVKHSLNSMTFYLTKTWVYMKVSSSPQSLGQELEYQFRRASSNANLASNQQMKWLYYKKCRAFSSCGLSAADTERLDDRVQRTITMQCCNKQYSLASWEVVVMNHEQDVITPSHESIITCGFSVAYVIMSHDIIPLDKWRYARQN